MRCWCGFLSGARCRQIVCTWSSRCHCIPKPHHLLPRLKQTGLPFWYRLTQVVLEKRPSNGCSSSSNRKIVVRRFVNRAPGSFRPKDSHRGVKLAGGSGRGGEILTGNHHLAGFLVVLGNVGVLVKTEHFRVGDERQAADVGEVGLVGPGRRRVVEAAR